MSAAADPDRILVDASALSPATLTPPLSKSDAHRALTLGHLLGIDAASLLPGSSASWPIDVQVLDRGLGALRSASDDIAIDCHEGGAPFRILLGQAAIAAGRRVTFTGSARLGERPHGALVHALRDALGDAGLRIDEGSPWPLIVHGATRAPSSRFCVDARSSSQFVTSVLLVMAALALREGRSFSLELLGEPASRGYLNLTTSWLRRAGFIVAGDGRVIEVSGGQPASAERLCVPGDWSSIAYLLLIAWRSGGAVANVDVSALHPDQAILPVLQEAGLEVVVGEDHRIAVAGTASRGVSVSGQECPDLLPTVAALACALPSPTTLREVSILRFKESDRLAGIMRLAQAGGARTRLDDDVLTIFPGQIPRHVALGSAGDHRLAMSAAVLAVLGGSTLEIEDAACVDKSFPGFWQELAGAGARLTR